MVPRGYKKDPQLGTWVDNQRLKYKNNKFSEQRAALLNGIGFCWGEARGPQRSWDEMYQQLVAYEKVHNATRVLEVLEHLEFGLVINARDTRRKKCPKTVSIC